MSRRNFTQSQNVTHVGDAPGRCPTAARLMWDALLGALLTLAVLTLWRVDRRELTRNDDARVDATVASESDLPSAPPETRLDPVTEPMKPGPEDATEEPRRVAIIDTFQPFMPRVIDIPPPPPAEVTSPPDPEPPKVVDVPPPAVDLPATPEPETVEFFETEARASSVGFVVDCSSSMSGSKFQAVCNELASSILQLSDKQKFFVVFFNEGFYPMSGNASAPKLVEADAPHKQAILRFLTSAQASGGTEPEPAIRFMAALRPDVIYLLTDGEFDGLSVDTFNQLAATRTPVHTIAFETGGRVAVLEEIARRTGGTAQSAAAVNAAGAGLFMAPPAMVRQALRHPDPATRKQAVLVTLLRDLPYIDDLISFLSDPDLAADVHAGLRQAAGGSDFGPHSPDEVSDAKRRWKMWWDLKNSRDWRQRVVAGLTSSDADTFWVSAAVARTSGLNEPDHLVTALRHATSPVWQELHAALVRCCPAAGDLGPSGTSATIEQVAEAADRWAAWRKVEAEKEMRARFEKKCKTAAEYLRLAKLFLDTKPDVVERRCEEILRDFGDTPAADEARQLLESLRRGDTADTSE